MQIATMKRAEMTDCKPPQPPISNDAASGSRHTAGQDPVKRQQILDGAKRVFMSMGFDAASMNDITREAGVSKSTIYVYFDSKDELFEMLCEQHRDVLFAEITAIHGTMLTDKASFIAYGIALSRLVTSDIVVSAQRTILGVTERKPDIGKRFYERGPYHGLQTLMTSLEALQQQGRINVPDVQHAAHQLAELFLAGTYRQRLFAYMDQEPTEEQIRFNIEAAVNMFFAAYGTRDSDKTIG